MGYREPDPNTAPGTLIIAMGCDIDWTKSFIYFCIAKVTISWKLRSAT